MTQPERHIVGPNRAMPGTNPTPPQAIPGAPPTVELSVTNPTQEPPLEPGSIVISPHNSPHAAELGRWLRRHGVPDERLCHRLVVYPERWCAAAHRWRGQVAEDAPDAVAFELVEGRPVPDPTVTILIDGFADIPPGVSVAAFPHARAAVRPRT